MRVTGSLTGTYGNGRKISNAAEPGKEGMVAFKEMFREDSGGSHLIP